MNKETIIAIIRLIVPLVCSALTVWGINVDADALMVGIGYAVSAAAFVWAWWKNNSVTAAAQKADEYMRALKDGGSMADDTLKD